MFELLGPAPPKAMLLEPLGNAFIGAVREPFRLRWGLQASNGPSWWNTRKEIERKLLAYQAEEM
jgi:hypothetical protein